MKKTILYILGAAVLTSCSDEVVNGDVAEYLNGKEKTPITVVSNITASSPVTRAVDAEFETNDLLNAYIKHVTVTDAIANPLVYSSEVTGTGVGPRLANFKITALTDGHKNDADNWRDHTTTSTLTVTDAAGLYWDDFSNSASAATDLRTDKHALMVYYGYGYNGGTASTALTESTGVLGWTVATDQTSGFKTSDLLYAGQQTPVAYTHGTNNTIDGRDRVLTIPYTHAMSKVTIEVICDEGFDEDKDKNFGSAAVKLNQAGTVATVTGPTKSVSKGATPADINMQKLTPANKNCSFSALMAPTVIKAGETFATIEGIDGNNYTISLTDAALTTATAPANAWSTQLAAYNATSVTPDAAAAYTTANGGLTKPGVHYMLTVTIKKQQIKVEATIQDWKAVSAKGVGEILFDNDITDKDGDITSALQTNGFDLYKSTTTTFGTKATTISYSGSEWTYDPKIYWQNKDDKEYFRALSGANDDDAATTDVNESLAMSQGKDVLWGTTAEHSGKDVNGNSYSYEKGAQIDPRTGKVPLAFEHAMSKISVELKTSGDNAAVNLEGATISIINTYNEGKIDLNTGDINDLNLKLTSPEIYTISGEVTKTDDKYQWLNNIVIPQSLVSDKDEVARETAPTFYQSGELTLIYNDGTSMATGGGSGTYYLTTDLTPVPVTLYDATSANAHNAGLTDARPEGYEEKYTEEEAIAYNAALDGAVKEGDAKPSPGNYTEEEAKEYNAKLDGAVKAGDQKPNPEEGTYTEDEAAEYNANLQGAVSVVDTKPSPGNYTADEAKAYNEVLPGAVTTSTTKKTYTADDANTYNATLDGAVAIGDVKIPAHYVLPDNETPDNTSKVSHTPGELKSAGTKIMMYITLADGTRYSIELSKCEDKDTTKLITEWKRGEHYTYEITLGKEEITFRALVKEWVEKKGSGNATLDWD